MKVHYPLIHAIVQTLQQIFQNNKYADRAIEHTLHSNPKWGARDRAFIAETTYEIVRWWRKLWTMLGREQGTNVSDLFVLVGFYLQNKGIYLPLFKEFDSVPKMSMPIDSASLAVQHSIPDWLDALIESELGDKKAPILTACNAVAPVFLRCNTLKNNRLQLLKNLALVGIEAEAVAQNDVLIRLKQRKNVFQTPLFKEGLFEVQDGGSQHIGTFTEVKPSMRVIDACAGAGGKTLHLAALMQNKGKIIAMDVEEWKLQELRKRAKRAGAADLIETRLIENSKTIKQLYQSADLVLLDAPCSGLGVLRRNPDAKWKLQPAFIDNIRHTQADILKRYAEMVAIGGTLVYATCSILPSENENQVQHFLENCEGKFQFMKEKTIYPNEMDFDGFYMAMMKRIG
jgi:16S rRNA (cytosine967-C5)-methyltransferase